MAVIGDQTVAWDALGQVSSVTTAAGRTSYVNDASGDPLVESDPSGATTLFLGSEDVTVTVTGSGTAAAVSKVVRYYSVGGAEVAYRVDGASPTYVEDDLQGTNRVAYTPSAAGTDPAAKVSRSFTDPYGNSLSATTASSLVSPVLATGRSFLNAPADGDTGLVSLGVRKYDPVTGSFLSVDPVAVTGDPGQLNGYAYGGGNPVSHADPSGAMYPSGGGSSGGSGMEDGPHSYGCRGNCGWSRADTRRYDARMAANRRYEAAAWRAEQARERQRAEYAEYRLTHGGWRAYAPRRAPRPRPVVRWGTLHATATASVHKSFLQKHGVEIGVGLGIAGLTVLNAVQFGADPLTDGLEVGAVGEEASLIAADGAEEGAADEEAAASCGGESFSASTKVLTATGGAVALSSLQVGAKVRATDPKTGASSVRRVDKVWVNRDTDLMDVTVRTGGTSSVVHTTAKHPFWDATTRAWTRADHLRAGDRLMSAAGVPVTVASTKVIPGAADMWDLTIDGLHDFYILATPGTAGPSSTATDDANTVLVHNCPMSRGARARVWKRNVENYGDPTCENCGVEVERPVAPQRCRLPG